jgi:hypothetical protein
VGSSIGKFAIERRVEMIQRPLGSLPVLSPVVVRCLSSCGAGQLMIPLKKHSPWLENSAL